MSSTERLGINFKTNSASEFAPCTLVPHDYNDNEFVVLHRTDIIAHSMVRALNEGMILTYDQQISVYNLLKSELDRKLGYVKETNGVRFGYVYNHTRDTYELRYGNGAALPRIVVSNIRGVVLQWTTNQWVILVNGKIVGHRYVAPEFETI